MLDSEQISQAAMDAYQALMDGVRDKKSADDIDALLMEWEAKNKIWQDRCVLPIRMRMPLF